MAGVLSCFSVDKVLPSRTSDVQNDATAIGSEGSARMRKSCPIATGFEMCSLYATSARFDEQTANNMSAMITTMIVSFIIL